MPPTTGMGFFCNFRWLGLSVRCFLNASLMTSGFMTMEVPIATKAQNMAVGIKGI